MPPLRSSSSSSSSPLSDAAATAACSASNTSACAPEPALPMRTYSASPSDSFTPPFKRARPPPAAFVAATSAFDASSPACTFAPFSSLGSNEARLTSITLGSKGSILIAYERGAVTGGAGR
eukprot:31257-Pelagococcus_subviridis.AAC.5